MVVVVAMIFIASSFSLYSIFHPRYVFKRLAGFLHLMTTLLVWIVIEVGLLACLHEHQHQNDLIETEKIKGSIRIWQLDNIGIREEAPIRTQCLKQILT